jgi:hypothetical protein
LPIPINVPGLKNVCYGPAILPADHREVTTHEGGIIRKIGTGINDDRPE